MAARDAGYEVHVATPDGAGVERIREAGLPWHRVRYGPMRRKPWSDLQSILDTVRLYRALRPDLVHHVTFKAILYGTIAARIARVRAVVNAMTGLGDVFVGHAASDRAWRFVITMLFRVFVRHPRTTMIVQNEHDSEVMRENGIVSEGNVVLIRGSGVDPDVFHPIARPQRSAPVVAFVGRITETKGIGDFAAAARHLRETGVNARFVAAGMRDDGSGKVIGQRRFDEWISRGDFEYLGLREDVREVYAVADIVCLPTWGGEGVPKALIEAAACELPSVATEVPGCGDIVRNGENGFLVPPHDPARLAAALRVLIEDPESRARMGSRGRRIVIDEFSLERVVGETLGVYTRLLA